MDWSESERQKYERVYAMDLYREGPGTAHTDAALAACGVLPGETLADYGCGGGHALVKFQDAGISVIGTDIADSLLPEYRHYVPFLQAPVWDLPENFPITDWAFSAHMIEHLPTEKVDDSLAAMAAHTARGLYLIIFHLPDTMGDRIGERLHLTVQPWKWWLPRLERFFVVSHVEHFARVNGDGVKETRCLCTPRESKATTPIPDMPSTHGNETVCVVGHGPSLIGAGMGERIDAHDVVVRFTWRRGQRPEDYGAKVSYIVTSLRNHNDIVNDGTRPERGVWLFTRPGAVTYESSRELLARLKKYGPSICREVWPWYVVYRDLGANGYIDPRQGAPGLIPSFSQGTGGIIAACHRLRPRRITLAGCDNLWAGQQDGYNDFCAIQRGEPPRKSGHDLGVERLLLDELMHCYDVEIGPLVDETNATADPVL